MEFIPLHVNMLSDLVDLWNSEIGTNFPMRVELFKQNSFEDENIVHDGSFVAIDEDNQIEGFVIAKKWQEHIDIKMNSEVGWIQTLLVRTSSRQQGIGSALLERAETALKENGCKKIFLGSDPWHYFPGIPIEAENARNWFEDKGYDQSGVVVDLVNHYELGSEQRMPVIEDVVFSILKRDESEELLSFLHRCFPGRWEYEAYHYFKRNGTGREFVVIKKEDRIIGFCRINDANSPFIAQNVYWAPSITDKLGGIGPLGIDQTERKKGYGLAIVEAAVSLLRNRGIDSIVIDWTGLIDFYGKLSFKVWKEYQQYSKEL